MANTATAHGIEPGGSRVGSEPATAVLRTTGTASLSLVKRAGPDRAQAPGDLVEYVYTVTNTGSVTVVRPRVVESRFGGTGAAPTAVCPQVRLAPGQSTECSASYILTAADFAAGRVVNTAHAESARADNGDIVRSDKATATVTVSASSLSLAKSAVPDPARPGDTVDYSYQVGNTGQTLLHNLRVTEESFTGHGTAPVPVCPATELAAGATMTCKATYTVTAADVAAGFVANTALVQATTPAERTVAAKASARIRIEALPRPGAPKPPQPARHHASALPATGAQVGIAGIGAALLAAGAVVLFAASRRRRG